MRPSGWKSFQALIANPCTNQGMPCPSPISDPQTSPSGAACRCPQTKVTHRRRCQASTHSNNAQISPWRIFPSAAYVFHHGVPSARSIVPGPNGSFAERPVVKDSLDSAPNRLGREAHQNRIDIAAGLEPEQSAPVIDEVEFGIATAPFELGALVRIAPLGPHAADRKSTRLYSSP